MRRHLSSPPENPRSPAAHDDAPPHCRKNLPFLSGATGTHARTVASPPPPPSPRLLLPPPPRQTPPAARSGPHAAARARAIEFGKYKGQMLGTLPPSYLRWVVAELDYGDTAPWASLAREVLDDPVYVDRVEWEHAHRFLRGDANYDYAYDDGPLQEMAERFGWDLSDEEGWSRLDFRLIGTSYSGRIPRKGPGSKPAAEATLPAAAAAAGRAPCSTSRLTRTARGGSGTRGGSGCG